MVVLAQLVERQIVALEVKGSTPLDHPINFHFKWTVGCRQVVRHRILTPAFGGSNPSTPASTLSCKLKINLQ